MGEKAVGPQSYRRAASRSTSQPPATLGTKDVTAQRHLSVHVPLLINLTAGQLPIEKTPAVQNRCELGDLGMRRLCIHSVHHQAETCYH